MQPLPDGHASVTYGIELSRARSKRCLVRGQKVLHDADLAQLYHVPTSRLNEQVKRNRKRFPSDFMFQLHRGEMNSLMSQNAISNIGRGGSRKPAYAFTEQGVAMLSSVLKSDRVVYVNIAIMRVFVSFAKSSLRIANWRKKSRSWSENTRSTTRKFKRSSMPSAACWSRRPHLQNGESDLRRNLPQPKLGSRSMFPRRRTLQWVTGNTAKQIPKRCGV